MIIKPLDSEHFEDVTAIASYYVTDVFKLPRPGKGVGVFDDNGVLLAYIMLFPEYSSTYSIPSLATRQGYEGRGIMRKLFNHLDKTLEHPTLWLEVHPDNLKAIKLYTSLGFTFTEGGATYADGKTMLLGERLCRN